MDRMQIFDVLIMVTLRDFMRLERNYGRLAENLPARRIFFCWKQRSGRAGEKSRFRGKGELP